MPVAGYRSNFESNFESLECLVVGKEFLEVLGPKEFFELLEPQVVWG